MKQAIDILKEQYLSPIKASPKTYIGVELEFPIVNLSGEKTVVAVSKALMFNLVKTANFVVEKKDTDGNPVQLLHKNNGDRILFEVSYNILEVAFAKARTIQEVDKRFQIYLTLIQSFLRKSNHELQGHGIHPSWDKNDNRAVKLPRYQMLLAFLKLSTTKQDSFFHHFPDYGSFICGNQVQVDVNKENYVRVINAFNQIEPLKAYLFANSSFSGADWNTRIARDVFWERSMHGIFEENVGIPRHDYQSEEAYFETLSQTALFTVERSGELLYFDPIRACDFLSKKKITAYNLAGESVSFSPKESDFLHHRSYHYQTLTRRGTVEFRSICTQPLEATFAPIAFHLGLFENLDKLEKILEKSSFYADYHQSPKELRRLFSQKELKLTDKAKVEAFGEEILDCSLEGLQKRNYGEEIFLKKNRVVK